MKIGMAPSGTSVGLLTVQLWEPSLCCCVVRGLWGLEVHSSHILQWILTARNSPCLYKWKNEDFLLNLMHPSDPQAFFSLAADTQN